MIEKLKNVLNELDVYFYELGKKEIVIPCPADFVPFQLSACNSFGGRIVEDSETVVFADEVFIHVWENNGSLNWLVAMENPDYDC